MAKRGQTEVSDNKARFLMDVRQDSDSEKFEIAVEMDFTGVTREKLIEWCCAGSSRRVVLQSALRKLTTERLEEMADDGLIVAATSCTDLKSPQEKRQEMIAAMSDDERKALAAELAKALGN